MEILRGLASAAAVYVIQIHDQHSVMVEYDEMVQKNTLHQYYRENLYIPIIRCSPFVFPPLVSQVWTTTLISPG